MIRRTKLLVVASIATAITSVSGAENLTLTFTAMGPATNIKLSYDGNRAFNQSVGSGFQTYSAGRLLWQDQAGHTLQTYCTQLNEHVSYGQTITFAVTDVANVPDAPPSPMGAVKAALVRELYTQHWSSVRDSSDATLNAAFQLAVWEISHENLAAADTASALAQLDLYAGAVAAQSSNAATNQVASLASALLGSLVGVSDADFGGLVGLTHGSAQDQLLVVPLPFTAGLAGLGLVGALALRRRMR